MPTSTKWRIRALAPQVGGSNVTLSQLQLYAGATRVDDTATLASSLAPISGALANLQDSDTSTLCTFAPGDFSAPGFYIEWTFGSAIELTDARFGSGPLKSEFIAQFDLQYWSGTDWVPLGTVGTIPWPGASALGAACSLDTGLVLLLHFDGVNGAPMTGAVDSSLQNFNAPAATAIYSNSQSVFGGSSGLFAAGTYMQIGAIGSAPDSLSFGTGDFCIALRARFNSTTPSGNAPCLLAANEGPRTGGYGIYLTGAKVEFWSENTLDLYGATTLTTGVWYHIAVTRSAGVIRIFVNGVLDATLNSSAALNVSTTGRPLTLGGYWYGGAGPNGPLNANLDELAIYKGKPVWTANFTPPAAATNPGTLPLLIQSAAMVVGHVPPVLPMDPPTTKAPAMAAGNDIEFYGNGRLYGTTEVDGSPDFPKVCKVRLQRERDGLTVAEQWSNAAGQWDFRNINAAYVYKVEAFDHTHDYRASIADNLTPEVMA